MSIFVDTAYIVGLLRKRDSLHARALAAKQRYRSATITTEYVLIETLNSLSSQALRGRALDAVEAMRRDPGTLIIPASPDLLDAGMAMFRARPDKSWGLTDCISFVVMEREGLTEALTDDHHFEQAGFTALLRSEG